MTRDQWFVMVLLALCAVLLLRDCSGDNTSVARAAQARADMLADSIEVVRADNRVLSSQIAQLDTAYAIAQRERDIAYATSRAQIDAARSEAARVAQALRSTLDSAQAAALSEYEAEISAEREAYHQTILNQAEQIVQLEDRVAARDELIQGLRAEIELRTQEAGELRAANDALRAALRSQNKQMALLRVGGVVLLGAAIYGQVAK